MFAVIETGSKQYHIKVGDVIKVEQLQGEVGSVIELDKVLSAGDKIGDPLLSNAMIKAEVLEQKKTDKIIVFKKKRRHNYRRKQGHRQLITVLKIKEIVS
ncbi:50S ribosomal protein L21 [endosymbiont of Acanthamoeba sp. UWC8]|nr:50S ribosomal protein L21 [Candidatus Jidaibacter acanthamoeba]AIF81542.1 50S ribosomal protein L21 [endosymbiont of Acanthamoeba sp. UWC8]MBA8667910.1 50S ribosomal protein L21 [Holosporaceae bacterium 'Namur']